MVLGLGSGLGDPGSGLGDPGSGLGDPGSGNCCVFYMSKFMTLADVLHSLWRGQSPGGVRMGHPAQGFLKLRLYNSWSGMLAGQ